MYPIKKLILKNINVITMKDENILYNMDIHIDAGVITSIEETTQENKSRDYIDCSDKYLIPGLYDCHVHLERATDIDLYLAYGVTSVINMMGKRAI
ncbi:hypothetical protein EZV73_02030 [Acidaminobacter sp. JC074]|uniref:hypothetical protein n=1 Tax=Acidaminobacter sp. JC074 TaxID=2530199 RepID=UPI001F1029ED|nr:hypothetical protein [Acidaminobacter sp. JC074]MCH4886324.1 hypothetical protein [Acidaminobacter sp. JC074]